jgi:hypothetical protein
MRKNDKREMIAYPLSVRASEYKHRLYAETYTDEKFDYCPKCGEKIDWGELECQLFQSALAAGRMRDKYGNTILLVS